MRRWSKPSRCGNRHKTKSICDVSTNWDKGVLKISMAKKAEAEPRQIKVNVGSEETSKPGFMARRRKTGSQQVSWETAYVGSH